MKFGEIVSIEEIPQEEPAEDDEDAETPPIVFEIEATCVEDPDA